MMDYVLSGYELNKLRRRAIVEFGAKDLELSERANKKYVVTLPNDKKVHFGHRGYEDFTIHKNLNRRRNYRKRASKIRDKDGKLTYKNKESPNFWSFHLLW